MADPCPHCEALREEVAYLRGELALDLEEARVIKLRSAFGIQDQEARLLLIMLSRRVRPISSAVADELLPGERSHPKFLAVYAHRLRKVLGYDGIAGVWGQGYLLTEVGRAKVEEALA